ncbi:MAG: V-type ATP synthase subunit D [Burkholderiales bacterium]
MTEATPTRAVALELMDERRAMREGYVFLDEKCLLLAGAIMAELARYAELARVLASAHDAATDALRAAVARHGLEGLAVYPAASQGDARLAVERRSVMGVPLQDAAWRPADAPAPAATHPSPEAEACRRAYAAAISAAAAVGAVAGNLERLSLEYRRSVRRARALQDVLLPELDRTLAGIETRLEELEQEDAISMRRRG